MPEKAHRDGDALRRLAVQQAATRALADAADLSDALRGILESVCLALDWQVGEAWTMDADAELLRCAAQWRAVTRRSSEFERDSQLRSFRPDEGLPGRVWRQGSPLFIEDVTGDEGLPRARTAAAAGLRSAVGFPIEADGELVGVMCFYTHGAVEPSEALLSTLRAVGQQIGHVIRRREAEASVRVSEARHRAVLNASLDAIVSVDHEGSIIELNQAAERIFGYAAAEAVGRPMADLLVPPHLRERHLEAFERHLRTGEGQILCRRTELEALRKDGSVFPVELTVVRVEHDGRPTFTATIRDISDRRRAEGRLREEIRINMQLQRLALAFSTEREEAALLQLVTDTGTILADAEYGAFFFEPQSEDGPDPDADGHLYALSGATPEAFRQLRMPGQVSASGPGFDGRAILRIDDVREEPRFAGLPPPPDGSPPIRSYMAVPVRIPGRQVMGGLFFGHSRPKRFSEHHEKLVAGIAAHAAVAIENLRLYERLKRSEERAREAYRVAADAVRRKDEFIAMLSHELRNPLAPILTAVDLMKMEGYQEPTDQARVVIERQARHLLRLVDDLLDVSRITRGKLSLDLRAVELRRVIESAIEMASPLFEKKAHRLHVSIDSDIVVEADPARLTQVVTNLLTNAARYTPDGGNVWLRAERRDGEALVTVRDDGKGMAGDLLERIFEPFSQGERDIDRSEGGLGLGLALVRTLTEKHGGSVEVQSDGPGRGSEFVLRLPAAEDSLDGFKSRPTQPPPADRGIGRSVLVVDDNEDAAEILARGLRRAGYEVHVAHDGPSALALAPEVRPDIAVLDIGLPVMDGYELARRLRTLPGFDGVRLLALTGYGQSSDRRRAFEAGFDVHLVKPITMEELCDRIHGR